MFLSKCYNLIRKYAPVVILSVILGVLAYRFTTDSLKSILERSLIDISEQGAVTIENEIQRHVSILKTLANIEDIKDPKVTAEAKVDLLLKFVAYNEVLSFGWIDNQGMMYDTTGRSMDVSDRIYFTDAANGIEVIYKSSDNKEIVFSVPVYNHEEVVGVLSATYPIEMLCKIVENTRLGKSGYGFIIDQTGQVIAHPDRTLVESRFNAILESGNDPELKALASLEKEMIAGKTAAGQYRFKGVDKYMGYTKIKGLPWYFGETALKEEVFDGAGNLIIMIFAGTALFVLILIAVNIYLGYLKSKAKMHQGILKTAIDAGNIISITFSADGVILGFNKNAERQFKEKINLEKTGNIFGILIEKDREKLKKKIEKCLIGGAEKNFELIFKEGSINEHVYCTIHRCDLKSKKDCLEILGVDITERARKEIELRESHEELTAVYEELAASEGELKSQLDELIRQKIMLQDLDSRYNLVVEASNIGIWDWDVVENETYYSDKWVEMFGFDMDDGYSAADTWQNYIVPEDRVKLLKSYNDHIVNMTSYYECDFRYVKDGRMKWIYAVGKGLWDSDGKLVRMAGAHTDITSKKESEGKIIRLAYCDSLTGLPNRSRLIETFQEILNGNPKNMALVFMDLDDFKLVNDSYGHSIGDRILIEVAGRLQGILEDNMILSRLGGDEYAILIRDYESKDCISAFVEEMMRLVDGVIALNDYHINLSTSVGIATYPEDAKDFDELFKNADTAMYKAKERRNKYVFYHKDMNDAIIERLNLTNYLRGALENDEFIVYYQPQYRVRDRKVIGFEALLRWNSPKLGMVSPVRFIPVAEESKLINPIGEYVLRTALSFLKRVNCMGYGQFLMCINISIIQLMQKDFIGKVLKLLEEYDIPSEFLELEITESVLMESIASVIHNIILLRKAGVKIALDDFGTGYSSLNYLTQLPINTLKIDKSFIDNIGHVKEKSLLISTIVDIGRKLGLSIVAEGVEMQEQLDYLTRRRCDRVQGFLLSKPLPENEILDYLGKIEQVS